MWHKVAVLLLLTCTFSVKAQSLSGKQELIDCNEKSMQLSAFASKKAVVMIFYCNSCPFSLYYDDRIRSISNAYSNVDFLLVNSSPEKFDAAESVDQMKSVSSRLGLTYINDNDQTLKRSLNATKCPEAFVLTPNSGDWEVRYHGAIDDNPNTSGSVRNQYLKEALDNIIGGSAPPKPSVRPVGCAIKTG